MGCCVANSEISIYGRRRYSVEADLEGWWRFRNFYASADVAYRSLLGYFVKRKADYCMTTEDMERFTNELVASLGHPPPEIFPPAVSSGFARKFRLLKDGVSIRLSSNLERLAFLASLPAFEDFKESAARPAQELI